MTSINTLIADILLREGWPQYTDHPDDSGGPTKGGITQAALAEWRGRPVTADEVRDLQRPEAELLLLDRYWRKPGFQQVAQVDLAVARELADTGVNMGPATAAKFLQRLLTAFNLRGRLYPDLKIDGQVGPATLGALTAYLAHRGPEGRQVILFCLDALQAVRYVEIAERREKDEAFIYGQILRRSAAKWLPTD